MYDYLQYVKSDVHVFADYITYTVHVHVYHPIYFENQQEYMWTKILDTCIHWEYHAKTEVQKQITKG